MSSPAIPASIGRTAATRPGDFLALAKPRITAMAVFMSAGALALAPRTPAQTWLRSTEALLAIALIVAAANALNMYRERDSDRLMERTRLRPLPAGRMAPATSLVFGLATAAVSLVMLWLFTNPLTTALGVAALVIYVLIYTPLKRRTTAALLIGAVPGAAPALMGWTAVTGHVEPIGFTLFLILFVWQIPHFLAISVFRRQEYERAGIHVMPSKVGEEQTARETLAYTTSLIPLSLVLIPLHAASWTYLVFALTAGTWLLVLALRGVRQHHHGAGWAVSYFRGTLVYLPALIAGLAVDGMLR